MSREELIKTIHNSDEWKRTNRYGFIRVSFKSDPILDNDPFFVKEFDLWLYLESLYNLIWFFAPARIGEKPKRKEYRQLTSEYLDNFIDKLELVDKVES